MNKPKALVALDILFQGGSIPLAGREWWLDKNGTLMSKVYQVDFKTKERNEIVMLDSNFPLAQFIREVEKMSREELFVRIPISMSGNIKYRWKDEERDLGGTWYNYEENIHSQRLKTHLDG